MLPQLGECFHLWDKMHSSAVNDPVSVDDVLHLSAAGVVRHCQNEVTAESITLAAVLFELLCVRDESY